MAGFPASINISVTAFDSTSVTISGTTLADSSGYDIQSPVTIYYGLSAGSQTYSTTATITSSAFSKVIGGLSSSTTWWFYAYGYNGLAFSSSNQVSQTTSSSETVASGIVLFM